MECESEHRFTLGRHQAEETSPPAELNIRTCLLRQVATQCEAMFRLRPEFCKEYYIQIHPPAFFLLIDFKFLTKKRQGVYNNTHCLIGIISVLGFYILIYLTAVLETKCRQNCRYYQRVLSQRADNSGAQKTADCYHRICKRILHRESCRALKM